MQATHPTRYLQQEIARLQRENEGQRQQIERIKHCLEALLQLYWDVQERPDRRDPQRLISQRLHDMKQAIGAQDASLLLLDEASNELVFAVVHSQIAPVLLGHRIAADVGVAGWVMQNLQPVVVNQPRQDWRFTGEVDSEFAFLTKSIVCVPMVREAKPIGVIELLNKTPGEFTEMDAILALATGQFITVALQGFDLLAALDVDRSQMEIEFA